MGQMLVARAQIILFQQRVDPLLPLPLRAPFALVTIRRRFSADSERIFNNTRPSLNCAGIVPLGLRMRGP